MPGYVTGGAIKRLREKLGLTQRELADKLCVSDKAVSKWESGRGLPDVSLLEPLGKALGVSVAELLSGELAQNRNRSGNMQKCRFYVCPVCGNVLVSTGEGAFSCCGVTLPPLEAEPCDAGHDISISQVENEYFARMEHEMEKEHYISFFALLTPDGATLKKLYPEQDAEARFSMHARGVFYACCNRHGLFYKKLPARRGGEEA